ncbi:MAG: hypothetical protein ABIR71_03260, partial [Chthoniobacterales bacterium]
EVTLWVHDSRWSPALERDAHVRHYVPGALRWAEINAADMTVYQLASDAGQHGAIWQVFREHPGIVILHDLNLQPLFAGLLARGEIAPEEYSQLVEFHQVEELGAASPLTGGGIENALGVALAITEGHVTFDSALELPRIFLPFAGSNESNAAAVEALFHLIDEVNANCSKEAAYWLAGRAGRALRPWFTELGARLLFPHLSTAVLKLCGNSEPPINR